MLKNGNEPDSNYQLKIANQALAYHIELSRLFFNLKRNVLNCCDHLLKLASCLVRKCDS